MPRGRHVYSHIIRRDGNIFGRGKLPEILGPIVGSHVIEDVRMQPFNQGPTCKGQSSHISEEEYERGPEAGPAATAACAAHETGPGVGVQLRDDCVARHGRDGTHPARLVDAGRARRA